MWPWILNSIRQIWNWVQHTSFESAIIMRAQAAMLHWEQTKLPQVENTKKRNIANLRIEYERDAIDVGHSLSQQQRYVSDKTITYKKGGKRWYGALTLLRRIWLEERAAGLGIEMLIKDLARRDWWFVTMMRIYILLRSIVLALTIDRFLPLWRWRSLCRCNCIQNSQ